MAKALGVAGLPAGMGLRRSRPITRLWTRRSSSILTVALVVLCFASSFVGGVVADSETNQAVTLSFSSSLESLVFTPGQRVRVRYDSPFASPLLSTWCHPSSPRQLNARRLRPFDGWAVVNMPLLDFTAGEGLDMRNEMECWLNLRDGYADIGDGPGVAGNSSAFSVRSRPRSKDDDDDEWANLELRDAPVDEGEEEIEPPSQPKRVRAPQNPSIPAPTSQTTSGVSGGAIKCPSDNLTVYTEPQTAKRYVIICGRDYSSKFGAVDIGPQNAGTMNQCLSYCAAVQGCMAVGWGWYQGTNTCWLKRSIGEPNWAPQWYVAVEDASQPGTAAAVLASKAAVAAAASSGGLSGDVKAGIGVGIGVAVVLASVAGVLIWYRWQRKRLKQRQQELAEKKLEADSNKSSAGSGGPTIVGSPSPSFQPPNPVTRGSSTRSDDGGNRSASRNEGGGAPAPPSGASTQSQPQQQPQPPPPPRIPPHLAHVARHMHQNGHQIPSLAVPEKAVTSPASGWTQYPYNNPAGSPYEVSPWSATQPASELPVREGYQGYGPEYEMSATAPRPQHHRLGIGVPGAAGRPASAGPTVPHWSREEAGQKFLLADMAPIKMKALKPDDRAELP